jgi:hypothetical protein
MRLILILAMSLSMSLVACGKDDKKGDDGAKTNSGSTAKKKKSESAAAPSGPRGACDRRANENICAEYHGSGNTGSFIDGECKATDSPRLDACPADGVIGRCVRWGGSASEAHEVYYAGAEKVFAACEQTGGKPAAK